jgi:hypothetical protein
VEEIFAGLSDYSPLGVIALMLAYLYAIRAD